MSRKLRIQYKGAMYHVMSRGDKNGFIFPVDNTKSYFVKLLGKGAERYQVDVYAFCVMGTHYHLLVQITKENLSDFMHFLGSSYANYLVRNGWAGHVFSGRYDSILVEREEYLLTVNRYIHLNPVSAGMVKRPEDYKWSSYPLYLGPGKGVAWLKREWLADYFGPDAREAAKRYREFISAGMEKPADYPHDKVVANTVLGSEGFLRSILSFLEEKSGGLRESIERQLLTRRLTLEDVIQGIGDVFGISEFSDRDYRKDKSFKYFCNLFIYMAREYTPASNHEIAEVLGDVPPNTISRRYIRVRGEVADNGMYRKRIEDDIERIVKHIANKDGKPVDDRVHAHYL